MPRQPSAAIRDSSGNIAASVLPPAVGASSRQSSPARTGSTAASCSGRRPGQPSVLTMWCWSTGWSRSNGASVTGSDVQVDVVDARRPRRALRSTSVSSPSATVSA